ncbi:hypothetical protein THAOC_31782 [Thalassiosira oceanica]|uniref:Uncharacterized protein n=1 Tax=Thalassiosira oceanica TaxID=159749 RepID=K0RRQ8_THAOC|nr:hypothetical protein THAOC_31782 [Thalassiosira oceanica]|eukprot:EJK49352.1 hypothetical protein THAOC_31782 [Thalassiosira oceanica]
MKSEEIVDNLADPMEHFEDAAENPPPVGDIDDLEPPAAAASQSPADAAPVVTDESATTATKKRKKKGTGDGCNKKVPLTYHEALSKYWQKGLYVDLQSGEIRCSCNHKPTTKWDYEDQRLDAEELQRLKEAKELYFQMHPLPEGAPVKRRRNRRSKGSAVPVGNQVAGVAVNPQEISNEKHWFEMWTKAKDTLKTLREELKTETDEDVKAELLQDIEGFKKRKNEWAKLLRLDRAESVSAQPAYQAQTVGVTSV